MQWFPVYLAALLLAIPFVAGQASSDVPPLAEDPVGDVTGTPVVGPTQPVTGFEDIDLTGLWLVEDPDQFHVKLRLAHMDGQPGADEPGSYVFFTFDGAEYRVWQGRSSDNEAWFSSLAARDGAGNFRFIAPLASSYDTAAGLVWTSVDRDLIVGSSGASPGRGHQLTGIYAKAYAVLGYSTQFNEPTLGLSGPLADISDRLPDATDLTLDVQFGGADGSGGLSLHAAQPYRASNGAETTYVYDLEAANNGNVTRDLTLEAMHLPSGWNLTLPGKALTLEPGAQVTFQAVLSTPGFHEHGTSRAFHLRLADPKDEAASAQVELGLHYLAIPQPAGHHDTLYLHSHPWSETAAIVNPPLGGTSGVLTMNTLAEDPEDAGVPLTGYSWVVGDEVYGWAGCLDPALSMGLVFDQERTGTIRIPVSSVKPILGATLSGRLLVVPGGGDMQYCFPSEYDGREVLEVATIEATAPMQVGPNSGATFEAVIKTKGGRIAYAPNSHLVLELQVRGSGVGIGGTGGLVMEPGGSLQLPLEEYSDAAPVFQGTVQEGDGAMFSDEAKAAPAKDASSFGFGILAFALVAFAVRQRRA